MIAQCIPSHGADYELVVYMDTVPGIRRRLQPLLYPKFTEQLSVAHRIALPGLGPDVQVTQLDPQYGGLQCVESAVHPHHFVLVLMAAAMNSQHLNTVSKVRVVSGNHSPISGSAEVLR